MKERDSASRSDLHLALLTLAQHLGVTVPETVETVKAGIMAMADGADPEVVAGFFAEMDAVAELHIN